MRCVECFVNKNKVKNGQDTTHNGHNVKDPAPSQILINVATNKWPNYKGELAKPNFSKCFIISISYQLVFYPLVPIWYYQDKNSD
jgi:hypothetical protein